jgi:hypothetical protein
MRGRIRTAKPEVLKDEELWDLEVSTGLPLYRAFQGLWFYADREGRFEWRPRALKSDILPYWEGSFDAVLDALARGRFIVRYTVDGREYGWVRTLTRHQRFDHREPPSILPPPPDKPPGHAPTIEPGHAEESPGHARVEGKGRELERKGAGSGARAPVEQPLPEVPGLRLVDAPTRTVSVPTPEPPEEYLQQADCEFTPRDQAIATWKHYHVAGLPPGGVERLYGWLLEQARDYRRRHAKLPDNPRASGIRPIPGSDLDTTGAASAFRPTSDHERYASEHRLPLADAVAKCRGSPRWARLSTPAQWEEFTVRLQLWRRDGAFPDPNEPLPRPKPKEARA